MNDTTATSRKESLEERKAIIDAEIERIREIQKREDTNEVLCEILDKRIDDLQLEKDNLPVALFNDEESVAAWKAEVERQIDEEMAAYVEDGTHPSPIISGGDIVEIIPQAGDDEIPF